MVWVWMCLSDFFWDLYFHHYGILLQCFILEITIIRTQENDLVLQHLQLLWVKKWHLFSLSSFSYVCFSKFYVAHYTSCFKSFAGIVLLIDCLDYPACSFLWHKNFSSWMIVSLPYKNAGNVVSAIFLFIN